ncbi:phosphoribosylglycinamide formyltransferase [Parasphingopyxis lamellibrachiae]|uniref:Phosphoribosylglycinamide formyltransferase n=1 Tax=Parasphingopyxis lamellibrachiae TaxID=680125 RepID=A0A3D9FDI3_9SPHN|nr:phosphoribosylglycinamide formyltransferase [Parasphingopyxis lamellibrachiae]RED15632.1 formyltetrahydrofolate-dependent phosphoribosylglycinamide formyltransferase [Parasphingopyxis lamellibrachiae]
MARRARIAVLISGRGTNMAALLYAAKREDCPYEIVLVASNDPEARGLELAEAEGIPTFAQTHRGMERAAFDAIINGKIAEARADYVVLAGYMRILSPEFVGKWEGRMLNIHPSLLPKYKGLDTHQRALDAGDAVSGCTVHLVTAALDAGPILGQTEVAILPDDTAERLAARVRLAEHQLYPQVLETFVAQELDPDWLVAKVGELALALPETHAKTSHGAPGWRVGTEKTGKFFAYVSIHHHGEEAVALLVKTSGADEQAALIGAEPGLYYRPAYYGASGWIAIRLDTGNVDWDHIASWLRKSWSFVAPKKLQPLVEFLS